MIYKYIDTKGIPILESGEIRITNPSTLNDPFEVLPRIMPTTKEQIQDRLTDPSFRETMRETLLAEGEIKNPSEFEQYLLNNESSIINKLLTFFKNNPHFSDPKRYRDEIGELFGVTSFSRTAGDILMWSHYAEKHRGFVVGFDPGILDEYLCKVIYSSERVEYSNMLFTSTSNYLFFKILRTKSLHWSYEKEIRAILPWEICTKKDDGHQYLPFPPEMVRRIIFGSECSIKTELLKIAAQKYPNIEIFETQPNEALYELDLYKLEPAG